MTLPASANVTGGIRNFGELGNDVDGDCVCAATEHIRMCKAVTNASRLKKVLYQLGFKPPSGKYTLELYAEWLLTQNEKPGPEVGVQPVLWLQWLEAQGLIDAYGVLPLDLPTIKQAMVDYRGVIQCIYLTNNAYNDITPKLPWNVGPGKYDQPNYALAHAVALVEYNPTVETVVTWGALKAMTNAFESACTYGALVFVDEEDEKRLAPGAYADLVAATKALPQQ